MGRGPVMAHKKAATALQKGKIYGIHSKLIAVAAKGGPNPSENPTLFTAIEKARKDSVTRDVIEKAIRRGAGLDKDAATIEDIIYEGMAAGGVGVIVRALTDNRNRTASSFRSHFSKNGGNLGETGSLSSHMFKYRGVFVIPTSAITEEQIIESGCDDYSIEDEETRLVCIRDQYAGVMNYLKGANIEPATAGFDYIPNMEIEITDFEQGVKVMKLLQDLDEDDDVEKVWTNGVFDDILREKIVTFLESNGFRT